MDNEMAREAALKMQNYFEGLINSLNYPDLKNDLEFNEGFRVSGLWIKAINHIENEEVFLFESDRKEIIESFDNNSFNGSGWFELKILAKNWLENFTDES